MPSGQAWRVDAALEDGDEILEPGEVSCAGGGDRLADDLSECHAIRDTYEAGVEQHLLARLGGAAVDDIADPRVPGGGGGYACAQEHFELTQWMRCGEAAHDMGGGEYQRRSLVLAQNGRAVGADLVRSPVAVEAGGVDAVAGTDVERLRCQLRWCGRGASLR